MAALHRIGVLVERRAVELAEPVRIVREMSRHPIENDGRGLRGGRRRPSAAKSAGVPKRLVGANRPVGW